MTSQNNKSQMVGITEITERYLPIGKRRARRFVQLYLQPKYVGNRIYVEREKLEQLLSDPEREKFPLNL